MAIQGNPRHRLSTKGKSTLVAFLEILDLPMERKKYCERVQFELQENISKYKKKARETKNRRGKFL